MSKTSNQQAVITPAEQQAWFALLYTHAALTERIDSVLQERYKLSFSAYEILCKLKEGEPQPVRSLADRLVSVSPTRASRLMQELINAGHLQRGADQEDGRISLISFTEEGRQFAETVGRTFEEQIRECFVEPLDAEDIAAITRIWAKLDSGQF